MSHTATIHAINFIGGLVGVLGITIAIYLQLITDKICPPRYVILFLIFGVSMIMINSSLFINSAELLVLQFFAYVILALLELGTAYMIWIKLDLKNPVREVHDEILTEEDI